MEENKLQAVKKRAKKAVAKYIITCIIISLMLVVGIPFIPIGIAVFKKIYIWVPAIVFTVVGFYGTPIFWSNLPKVKRKWSVALAIYRDEILEINELASNFNTRKSTMQNIVIGLLNDGELPGYKMNKEGTALEPIVRKKAPDNTKKAKCEYCGASLEKGRDTCAHCGTLIH